MIRIILSIILLGGGVSLVRSTVGQGTDFLVFWKTGRALLEGAPLYDLARDGGMTFKYPPWIAPLFIPFSLFSFEIGKWLWGMFSTACLFGVFFLLVRRLKISQWIVSGLAIFYWGLWVIQALDGQVVVPLLFFTLAYVTAIKPSSLWVSAVPILLSTKIFTEIPVLIRSKEFLKPRVVGIGIAAVIALSMVSAVLSFHGDLFAMFNAWSAAAQSGATALNTGQTHGPKNQSLTILACRALGVSAEQTQIEVLISVTLYLLFFAMVWKLLRTLDRTKVWLATLAIVPVFHPLPWHHLYVFTFPLAALFVQEMRSMKRAHRVIGGIAIALIGLSAKRAWVFGLGETLEFYCGRAWGALILVGVFYHVSSKRKGKQ